MFAATTLNTNDATFVLYIASFTIFDLDIYLFCKAQIVPLIVDEVFIMILSQYIDFVDNFSLNLVAELSEYIKINNNLIDLVDN